MEAAAHYSHFVLIPMMAAGHTSPMFDLAKALAFRGSVVTFVTTPLNAKRLQSGIDECTSAGLPIRFAIIPSICFQDGMPDGCKNFDTIPSKESTQKFLQATSLLKEPILDLLTKAEAPRPSCVISGSFFGHGAWVNEVARFFGAPTLVFDGAGAFNLGCCFMLNNEHNTFPENLDEPFMLPGIPHRVFMTRNQIKPSLTSKQCDNADNNMKMEFDGMVVNSFDDLEKEYADICKATTGKEIWTVGPLSLVKVSPHHFFYQCNRGKKTAIDGKSCTAWLGTHKLGSVVYVCFDSSSKLTKAQLVEIGVALEKCTHPYVLAVTQKDEDTDAWWSEFEKRARGLVIKGCAPQFLILSHPSVGGFLTHCSWNSTLEGITTGVPMITWPLFSDQFFNEKLVVDVLGTGVGVGVKQQNHPRPLSTQVLIENSTITAAVEKVMDGGEEGKVRRRKAKEIAKMAKAAMEEGGSSHTNLNMLIQYGRK